MAQSPIQPPSPTNQEPFNPALQSFGGAVGSSPMSGAASQAGGMGVGGGGMQSDIAAGAGVLKTLLGSTGAVLGSRELSTAAQALGGATGIYKLVNYFSQGAPGGLGGGLGAAGGIGAIVSGLLSVAASETGNPDLQKAAGAAGAATSAIGLAQTGAAVASIVSSMGGVAAAGAAAGSAAAATAGATAGLSVGAGAAFAPIAAALLISTISGLAGGEDPFGEGIQDMMKPLMGDYASFYKDLGTTLEGSRTGMETLYKSMPYAQSQEDLGQIVDAFKAQQAERIGGYGVGSDRFTIPDLPGAGGSKHEGGQIADFGPSVAQLNQGLQGLYGKLPAGQETRGITGKSVWDQVLRETQTQGAVDKYGGVSTDVPAQHWARGPSGAFETISGAQADSGEGWAVAENVYYGDPRYNYAMAGVPAPPPPGMQSNLGAPSTYWEDLMRQPNAVPDTGQFQPGTIGLTGGMRTGIGQRAGAFGGARSPSLGGGVGTVSPNITQGLAQNTGFIPSGSSV
jgi:hypothetical protein